MLHLLIFLGISFPTFSSVATAQTCQCPAGFSAVASGKGCSRQDTLPLPTTPTPVPSTMFVGEVNSGYLGWGTAVVETTGNNNLPLATTQSNNAVTDQSGATLFGTNFPLSAPWINTVQSDQRISVRGGNDGSWYSKSYCMTSTDYEHHMFYVGADNEWQMKIDGVPYASCRSGFCFRTALFLGKVLPPGNHIIELKMLSYNDWGQDAFWFADYQNYTQDVFSGTGPAQLNTRFTSANWLAQNPAVWDYDSAQSNDLCPAGYAFSCASNACVRNQHAPCNSPTLTTGPHSCIVESNVKLQNIYPQALVGTFSIRLSDTQTVQSQIFTIQPNTTFDKPLHEVFAGQNINLISGANYVVTFNAINPDAGYFPPPPSIITPTATGCGGPMSVTPPSCTQQATVTTNPAVNTQFQLGLQTGTGPIQWTNTWVPSTGASVTKPLSTYFPTATFVPGTTYTVHYQIQAAGGGNGTGQSATFTPTADGCGTFAVNSPACGQPFVVQTNAAVGVQFQLGLESNGNPTTWMTTWVSGTGAAVSAPLSTYFPNTALIPATAYVVHYRTLTATGVLGPELTATFTNPLSYTNASFLNIPGTSDHHQTINFAGDPSTFVLTPPTGNPPQNQLSLSVTKNGVETVITYPEFLAAYQSSGGTTWQLLRTLGFTLAAGDHFTIKLIYTDCAKTTIGQLEVDAVCVPSAFENNFGTSAPYLRYSGGNPASIDPVYDTSVFSLNIPTEPNAFSLSVTGAGAQPIVVSGPQALAAYQASNQKLTAFLQSIGAPIAIGQQVSLSLSYAGCSTHDAGQINLNMVCLGSLFEQSIATVPPLLSLSNKQKYVSIDSAQSPILIKLSSAPIYSQADTSKIFVVVTENGTPRPTRLTYSQVKNAIQSSGGNLNAFLKAIGITPTINTTYGFATVFEGACAIRDLGQLSIKINFLSGTTCQYKGAFAKAYPSTVAPGQTVNVKLEGVNDHKIIAELIDMKGAQVAKWSLYNNDLSPLLNFTMPAGIANGIYVLWFHFPQCWVGSDLSAKILIRR